MTNLFRGAAFGGVLGLLLVPSLGLAQSTPPALSWQRVSTGLDARGALIEQGGVEHTAFRPGAYVSYSVTSQMSVAATVERGFSERLTIGHAGLRFLVAHMGAGQVAAGANLVSYSDEGAVGLLKPTSWSASLHGAYPVSWNGDGSTLLYGTLSAELDPDNEIQTYRIGLRWQAWGGRP
jgi:hypothetical protein